MILVLLPLLWLSHLLGWQLSYRLLPSQSLWVGSLAGLPAVSSVTAWAPEMFGASPHVRVLPKLIKICPIFIASIPSPVRSYAPNLRDILHTRTVDHLAQALAHDHGCGVRHADGKVS